MSLLDVLTESSERLRTALETTTRHLYDGRRVNCSLALLSTVALSEMPLHWGMVEVVPHGEDQFELVVGVGAATITGALITFLISQQQQQEEGLQTTGKDNSNVPLIGPFVKTLRQDVVVLALLLLPAHGDLWNTRRRWLKTVLTEKMTGGSDTHFVSLLLLQEILLTSLLVSCHYKQQEVWVHRWWVVRQMIRIGEICSKVFHMHDRAVLLEAADKHTMNYNAWNYRRQVFALIFHSGNAKDSVEWFFQELDSVIHFFERHNGDSSAVTYLVFLLEQAALQWNATGESFSQLTSSVWKKLLAVTFRELRRHFDKGHESVWVLRLALMQWALRNRPFCGWTLQDELEFVSVYVTVVECGKENRIVSDVSWVDIAGSKQWTSYHALRYGLQLLRMVQM